jgi:hypothetical protein
VRRERRWFTAGESPARELFAPPGSNRSGGEGNEAVGASGVEGSPSGGRSRDQLTTRERQVRPCGVAERPVLPMKPGNAGGGKGPQLKTNARSNEGQGD